LALAGVLTAIAGYVDAVGFLKMGHLFVSFMSGDSTQLAVAASEAKWSEARDAGGVVLLFLLGVVAGRILTRLIKRGSGVMVLLIEAILLVSAAMSQNSGKLVLIPMVMAMGIQNAVMHRAGNIKTGLTYVTGTLVNLGEKVVAAFGASEQDARWAWVPYLTLWLGLIVGASMGAMVYASLQLSALFIPAAVLILLAAVVPFLSAEADIA
jgi:uncharacterized membrane protein YoaK (UPF0700 family)